MLNRSFYRLIVSLCLCAIIFMLAACGDDATPTPAVDPTATPEPTATATSAPRPTATNSPRPTATATSTPKPTATTAPKPTAAATTAASGSGTTPGAVPVATIDPSTPITTGKYGKQVEAIRADTIKKLDEMNDVLTDLRSQIINSEWDKAKDTWKKAHELFLQAITLTPQVFVNDLFNNMQAQLDERPTYGFQVLEAVLFGKDKPTKDAALPVAARLGRDGKTGRSLMVKTELDPLMVFRGMDNICGGMAEFLGEEGPNTISQTSINGTRAKLQALKNSYALFSPFVEQLNPDTSKKVQDNITKVDRLLASNAPDPHTVDLAAKELRKSIDEAADVLQVDPLLIGPALLTEIGNLRVAIDGAIDGLYRDNLEIMSEQFTDFEVGWEGKVGRSVKDVDTADYQAVNDLRLSVNEALYYGVTPDKDRAKQNLIDLAKALDKTIANVRKIPFTPTTANK